MKSEDLIYLYGDGHLGHEKTRTSLAAAKVAAFRANSDAFRVFEYLNQNYWFGATDDELEQKLGLSHQTASARRRGLVLKGLVVDSGRQRATRTGAMATVWRCKGVSNADQQR